MPIILFVADSLEIGGTELQLTLLAKSLPAPWTVRIVAFGGGMFAPQLATLGMQPTILQRRARFHLKPIWDFWKLVIKLRPDVIHSWSWLSSAIAAPMCKLLGIKFINGCIRNSTGTTRHNLREKIVFQLSDCIIANSYAGLNAWGISSSKGKVIYNALDPQRFKQINKENVGNSTTWTVVMAARMVPAKDFPLFILGARKLVAMDHGIWKFIALGDGEDRPALIAQAADLITMGVMEFPGVVDDIVPYLLKANIGVLLTTALHQEGLSNALMEYMACGLPVICQKSGGNNELVIPNETGLILETNAVTDFVEKLLWLVHHPSETAKMGEAGRERVFQLCDLERMVSEYIGVYQSVLGIRAGA